YVVIVALTDRQVRRLFNTMGRPDLIKSRKFSSIIKRLKNIDELDEEIRKWTLQHTVEEILNLLHKNHIPCAPVYDLDQVNKDPQLKDRGMFQEISHERIGRIRVPGIIIKLSESPGEIIRPAPKLGEHNDQILKELGYTINEIKEFKNNGII
ncbi:MAG: CoA transferase, partial [Candidatus Helarchaeota archaeon]